MSRDWTPHELHIADTYSFKETGRYLHDNIIVYRANDGKEIVVGAKKYPELFEKYPNLTFLWSSDNTKEIYDKGYSSILDKVEDSLSLIISEVDKGIPYNTDDVIYKWYLGKLDPNFYYCEENNKAFEEYLKLLMQTA